MSSDASALRRLLINRRDLLSEEERVHKSDAIWKLLAEVPEFQMAEQAFFYVSHGSEVDTTMMRRLAREMGLAVCAPRSLPGERTMQFHVLPTEEPLVSGPYGILQPSGELPLADLAVSGVVIVPGVAFDRQGARLGFGGGYYDRWLAGAGRNFPAIGLAFHEQLVEKVPVLAHDVPVHVVLTDKEAIDCRKSRG